MDLDTFLKEHVSCSPQQQWFVHFTDRSNLSSIGTHGLLSTRELRRRGIEIPATGGNQWSLDQDVATGMDAFVHLCFKKGHPMEKRATDNGNIQDMIYLKIKPEIIKISGVKISNDVSNKIGVTIDLATAMLDSIDLEVLYKRTDWKQPEIRDRLVAAEKCEILIPTQIPLEYILNPNG